jgi:hypothetical protein
VTDETASNSGTAGTDTTAATDRGEWTANTNGESLLLAAMTLYCTLLEIQLMCCKQATLDI